MIVVDASAIIELLLNTSVGQTVARRLDSVETTLHAPHLLDLEVAQVLQRFAAGRVISDQRATMSLQVLRDLDIERHPHDFLLDRIWALRANLTAYDGAYVALAEVLEAPLLTCDRTLRASPGHVARIEVVE